MCKHQKATRDFLIFSLYFEGIARLRWKFGAFGYLVFDFLNHTIIYYQKSLHTIAGLVSILRNWVRVCNCFAQIILRCYNTASIRQMLKVFYSLYSVMKMSTISTQRKKESTKNICKVRDLRLSTVYWSFDVSLEIFSIIKKACIRFLLVLWGTSVLVLRFAPSW